MDVGRTPIKSSILCKSSLSSPYDVFKALDVCLSLRHGPAGRREGERGDQPAGLPDLSSCVEQRAGTDMVAAEAINSPGDHGEIRLLAEEFAW